MLPFSRSKVYPHFPRHFLSLQPATTTRVLDHLPSPLLPSSPDLAVEGIYPPESDSFLDSRAHLPLKGARAAEGVLPKVHGAAKAKAKTRSLEQKRCEKCCRDLAEIWLRSDCGQSVRLAGGPSTARSSTPRSWPPTERGRQRSGLRWASMCHRSQSLHGQNKRRRARFDACSGCPA